MSAKLKVRDDRKYVITANFVDGRVNSTYDEENFECRLLGTPQTADLQDAENKILVAETSNVTYVGKSFGACNLDHAIGQYDTYVGVYDPTTGTMQVCDTQQFYMHSSFKEDKAADLVDGRNQDILSKNFREKTDLLTSSFGSSKKRRTMDSRHRHAISDDVLKGVLDSAIDHGLEQAKSHKQRRSEMADDDDSVSTIPPCNKDATDVQDVYRLADIVTEEDLNSLKHCSQVFVTCTAEQISTWRTNKEYPTFVLQHLTSLPVNEEDRLYASSLLMYLSQMIFFFKIKGNKLNQKDVIPNTWPISIKNKLMNTFTMRVQMGHKNSRCMPSRLRDTLCSYILTLCLIVDEFTLHLQDLQNDLGLNKLKMTQHAKALGCHIKPVSSGSEHMKAQLKLPLQFPKVGPVQKKRT